MTGWWQQLSAAADESRPSRAGLDELMTVVERLPTMPEAVTATADTIFDAVDENGDGRISRGEHQRLVDTWHGRGMATEDVFDRLDQDGDGYLSRAEFALLWTQFWISDARPSTATRCAAPSPRPPEATVAATHRPPGQTEEVTAGGRPTRG
ncbi:EF-hand domain-containing protein [Streptomyces sp. MMCC 100]|uniref:EF-hand domain-containing protein n=1 Tax=Streptomyces sp. MMCC 100 TaxID=3163555 RepID=UPI003596A4D3